MPGRVRIVEVGPRDGLQNEGAIIGTSDKVAFVDALSRAGLAEIEVGAFVSPKWVPQMADTDAVCRDIARRPGTRYSALVPNIKGLERAIDAGLQEVAIFAAASEAFSRRNINQSIDESLSLYRDVAGRARASGIRVRAYLSTVFGCPYEGAVPIERVVDLTVRLRDLGAFEIALSDTIGIAHPGQIWDVVDAVRAHVGVDALALHLHDTRGTALANVLAGLQAGIVAFDSSAGGLGGCPYAPGAAGNLATEDLLFMLNGLGIETGVSLEGVAAASSQLAPRVGHALPSRYLQAVSTQNPK
jgi:hydroxymethylglutaryl-CoA lyase